MQCIASVMVLYNDQSMNRIRDDTLENYVDEIACRGEMAQSH